MTVKTEKAPPSTIGAVDEDMSLDLIAAFALKQDEILELLDTAQTEGWTFEEFLEAVNDLAE